MNFRSKNKAIPTEKAFLSELTGLWQWSGVVKHSDYLTTKKRPDGVMPRKKNPGGLQKQCFSPVVLA